MLISHTPRLIAVVLYGILGIGGTLISKAQNAPQAIHLAAWPLQWLFYGTALMALIDWLVDRNTLYLERMARSRSMTSASQLAEQVRYMTSEQIAAWLEGLRTDRSPDDDEQESYTVIEGVEIPDSFIQRHLANADGFALPPIRSYADGSKERRWAQLLHGRLKERGAVYPASGNQSTRVRHWNLVTKAIGWE